jgi:hypothetical protein
MLLGSEIKIGIIVGAALGAVPKDGKRVKEG